MNRQALSAADVLTIVALGGVCLMLSAVTMPPVIKPGSTEVRLSHTWHQVRELHDEHFQGPASIEGESSTKSLEETDVWDEPFRVLTRDGHVRVVSAGPDGILTADGTGGDDIHSDMTTSPAAPGRAARERRLQLHGVLTLAGWFTLSWVYLRFGRAEREDAL